MNEATIALTVITFLIFVIFLGFLIWGISSGQFRNVEEPKYKIFEAEDDKMKKQDADENKAEKGEPKGGKGK